MALAQNTGPMVLTPAVRKIRPPVNVVRSRSLSSSILVDLLHMILVSPMQPPKRTKGGPTAAFRAQNHDFDLSWPGRDPLIGRPTTLLRSAAHAHLPSI